MGDRLVVKNPSLFEETSSFSMNSAENSNQRKSFLGIPNESSNKQRQSLASKKSRRLSFLGSYSSRRSSQDGPRLRLQNTYKQEPDENLKFQAFKFESRIYGIMENYLKDKFYVNLNARQASKELSDEIMRMAKMMLNNSRYKFITHVTIGQNTNQDLRVASHFVWNAQLDNFVSATYKHNDLYAVATLYAIYFE